MKFYVINSNNVSSEIFDNEAVIVNFITGKYFGITGSGPDIWRAFEKPCSLEQLTRYLSENYAGITDEQINKLGNFVETLVSEELLILAEGTNDFSSGLPENVGSEYSDPVLEIYDDLQELIVLDPVHDTDPERGWPAQQRMIKP